MEKLLEKAGLFGGTFNPVHIGHLRVAEEVRSGFGLDRVYFIPAAVPPHKENTALAGFDDRCRMIEESISSNPGFIVSDAEFRRGGPSYTVDTVREFTKEAREKTEFFLIIGMDAFFEIETWKAYESLFDLISFIVMTRPLKSARDSRKRYEAMAEHVRRHVDKGYEIDQQKGRLVHEKKQPVWVYNVTPLGISSSQIRGLAGQRDSIKYLVPEAVEEYILKKDLYIYDKQ